MTAILHIGLHKTASSYTQGLLADCRDDLRAAGLLYPHTGFTHRGGNSTREGAGSGHGLFSRHDADQRKLRARLLDELSDDVPTMLISSEEFTRPSARPTPEQLLARFGDFGTVKVVLVLRRQDDWIESYYKQIVDQYRKRETRSFDTYLEESGRQLLDFHTRFTPWRDLVGPENFHVLSYDDLGEGVVITRSLLELAGQFGPVMDSLSTRSVPRFDSVRAIDTLGLRILNSYQINNREVRTRTARAIYDAAPTGDLQLMSPEQQARIQEWCEPINRRIEEEWFTQPVPGFRFGRPPRPLAVDPPSGPELVAYLDRVIALCDEARTHLKKGGGDNDR